MNYTKAHFDPENSGGVRIDDASEDVTFAWQSATGPDVYVFFRQRASTALRAIADLFAAESLAALARPPLDAPSFASATAAGLRVSGGSGGAGGAWPVASRTI